MITPPDWYADAEIYKRDLSLEEWAHELQWRMELLRKIKQDKKDGVRFEHDRERRAEFFRNIADSASYIQKESFGSNIGVPAKWLMYDDFERIGLSKREAFKEGCVLPIQVNLSYDEKTVRKDVLKLIEGAYKDMKSKQKKDYLNAPFYGARKFDFSDARMWNNSKVLDCTDFYIVSEIMGGRFYRQADIAEYTGLPDALSVSKAIRKGKALLKPLVITRIKASIKK